MDDESGTAAWLPGVAVSRVTDEKGKDTFLHVIYMWDGEEYAEDFDPPRVRGAGQNFTIADMIKAGQLTPLPIEDFDKTDFQDGEGSAHVKDQ